MNKLLIVVSFLVIVSHLILGSVVSKEMDKYEQARREYQKVAAKYNKVVKDFRLVARYAKEGKRKGVIPVKPIEAELKPQIVEIRGLANLYLTGGRKTVRFDVGGRESLLLKISYPGPYSGIVEVPFVVRCPSWKPRVYQGLVQLVEALSKSPRMISGVYITSQKVIIEGKVVGLGRAGARRRRRSHSFRRR